MRNVTLKQLRALLAVVETGTVTGAAKALNVTAPAVSLQLRLLEENAGLPLIERTGEGPRPTDAGAEVLLIANRIESALAECAEALDVLKGVSGGRTSIGVVSTAKYFAPSALAAFAAENPGIDVRLEVGNRGKIMALLEEYDLDVAITGLPPQWFEVESAPFGDHPFIIIGPPSHSLAGRSRLTLEDLAGETFLIREDGSGSRAFMERLFREAGVALKAGMQIGSNETIKQAVMAGLGVAFISAHTVAYEIADRRLIAFDVVDFPAKRTWYVIKRADKRLLPAARALWNFWNDSGARFLPTVASPAQAA